MPENYAAHDLSEDALGGRIAIRGDQFVDGYGRTLSLRGFNVSSASKLPSKPNGLSHLSEGFYDQHRTVTFVGRPFPLDEADLHFRRLQAWGMPLIRLLVTWESIGHAGPNPNTDLDLEYIQYLKQLISLMPKYGLKCFVCAHQDVWSRFSGGSGAPGWTFEAAGLDIEAFTDTGLAYIHHQDEVKRASGSANKREPSGPFLWPSGYQKLAASTMLTLFWAGDALAPNLKCLRTSLDGKGATEEVTVKDYLQDAFVEAFGRLADEVNGLEACMGFEPLNEPHRGLVDLHDFNGWNYDTDLHIGHYPSLAESLALGSGYAQELKFYVKSWPFPTRVSHRSWIDPKGRSAWLPHADGKAAPDRPRGLGECVWRAHGLWDWDNGKKRAVILDEDYFYYDHRPGQEKKKIEWYKDCYAPFVRKFTTRMTKKARSQLSFVEPIANEFLPPWPTVSDSDQIEQKQSYAVKTVMSAKDRPEHFVYAPHFYDLNVLFGKIHGSMSVNVQGLSRGMFFMRALYFGVRALRRNYKKQIGNVVNYGRKSLGRVPVLIGEIGIPFDINNARAFVDGNFDKQRELLDALIGAMEDHLVGFTLWNFNPHNGTEHGDGWNREDFSVINGDDKGAHSDYTNARFEQDELYRGGRALDVVIRPYAVKVAGEPVSSEWDYRTLRFEFRWRAAAAPGSSKAAKTLQTEIYIPDYHYAEHELLVGFAGGQWTFDKDKQTLYLQQKAGLAAGAPQQVVVGVRKVETHLRRRVAVRRIMYPPRFPWSVLTSVESEMRWELLAESEVLFNYFLFGSFTAAVLFAVYFFVFPPRG